MHAQFVRSTVANGVITSVDLSAVREVPGVVATFTAADLELGDLGADARRAAWSDGARHARRGAGHGGCGGAGGSGLAVPYVAGRSG
ncbi:hypothetical protein [Actinacidiphila oryziradicis]|uniref:hypothetical protein n=1 Tax=Actinacidiphila oryziradicis TaxID=2571141 RepID=UPI003211D60C